MESNDVGPALAMLGCWSGVRLIPSIKPTCCELAIELFSACYFAAGVINHLASLRIIVARVGSSPMWAMKAMGVEAGRNWIGSVGI